MKIVKLKVDNIKKISAAEVTPDGNVITVGGKNAAGKTSLIDSIQMALGGKDTVPSQPIRKGESKAQIVLETEDLVISRSFTAKGTYLNVTNKKDKKDCKSPQALLDNLRGTLTFDPLEFSRMKASDQAETFKVLAGLNFSEMEAEHDKLFAGRTIINRDVKNIKARVDAAPQHEDAPNEEVSIGELTNKLDEAEKANQENERQRVKLEGIKADIAEADSEITRFDANVKGLQIEAEARIKELQAETEAKIQRLQTDIKSLINESLFASEVIQKKKAENHVLLEGNASRVAALRDIDTSIIKQSIRDADGINQKVRENAAYKTLQAEYEAESNAHDALTKSIDKIKADKERILRKAKMPVEGLGLDASEVTFNGLPFAQCSSAEQLRISVAMGMAMNPTLRILMIRDGSLLDSDSLAQITKMATEGDYQIWLEIVTDNPEEASVFIEDGMVKE